MENLSKEVLSFLDSTQGKVFLSTKNGREFLSNDVSIQWLVTQMGRNWLESPAGLSWLMDKETRLNCFLHEGLIILTCTNMKKWLELSERGKHWLHSGHGVLWLETKDGQEWLDSSFGKKWLGVPNEILLMVESTSYIQG